MTDRPRVVNVGGGFGGLAAAKALRHAPVDLTVVDRQAHHVFRPLLYQVATGVLSQANVAPPLRDVLRPSATRTSSSPRSADWISSGAQSPAGCSTGAGSSPTTA